MIRPEIIIALNHSVTIPLMISFFRFKLIGRTFYPFILFILLGFINESISLALISNGDSNAFNSNVYVLLESLIIFYQFYRWDDGLKLKYILISVCGAAIWMIDNFVIHDILHRNSVFRLYYSLVIMFLSISCISRIAIHERGNILKNAAFIICVTFLTYYVPKVFIELLASYQLKLNDSFYYTFWITSSFINCIANLLYAIAILCIHPKQEFTLPF